MTRLLALVALLVLVPLAACGGDAAERTTSTTPTIEQAVDATPRTTVRAVCRGRRVLGDGAAYKRFKQGYRVENADEPNRPPAAKLWAELVSRCER